MTRLLGVLLVGILWASQAWGVYGYNQNLKGDTVGVVAGQKLRAPNALIDTLTTKRDSVLVPAGKKMVIRRARIDTLDGSGDTIRIMTPMYITVVVTDTIRARTDTLYLAPAKQIKASEIHADTIVAHKLLYSDFRTVLGDAPTDTVFINADNTILTDGALIGLPSGVTLRYSDSAVDTLVVSGGVFRAGEVRADTIYGYIGYATGVPAAGSDSAFVRVTIDTALASGDTLHLSAAKAVKAAVLKADTAKAHEVVGDTIRGDGSKLTGIVIPAADSTFDVVTADVNLVANGKTSLGNAAGDTVAFTADSIQVTGGARLGLAAGAVLRWIDAAVDTISAEGGVMKFTQWIGATKAHIDTVSTDSFSLHTAGKANFPAGTAVTAKAIDADSLLGNVIHTGVVTLGDDAADSVVFAGNQQWDASTHRMGFSSGNTNMNMRWYNSGVNSADSIVVAGSYGSFQAQWRFNGVDVLFKGSDDVTVASEVPNWNQRLMSVVDLRARADSSAVDWLDTVITYSSSDVRAVNLADPGQMWDYNTWKQYDGVAISKMDGSDTGLQDMGTLSVVNLSYGCDSLRLVDVAHPQKATHFLIKAGANKTWQTYSGAKLDFLDGRIFVGDGKAIVIDMLNNFHRAYRTTGTQMFFGGQWNLVSPNAYDTRWQLIPGSSGTLDTTITSINAIRSPFATALPGHRDAYGRPAYYMALGSKAGLSVSSLNAAGVTAIYDGPTADTIRALDLDRRGGVAWIGGTTTLNRDQIGYYRNLLAATGDGWTASTTYADSAGLTAGRLPMTNPATNGVYKDVGIVYRTGNVFGSTGPRIWALSDSSLTRIDVEPNNPTRRLVSRTITNRATLPFIVPGTVIALSGADTVNWAGISGIAADKDSTIYNRYYVNTNTNGTPSSHYWYPIGNSASRQQLFFADHDTFTATAGNPLHLELWYKTGSTLAALDTTKDKVLFSKGVFTTGAETGREYEVGFDGAKYLYCNIWDETTDGMIGRKVPIPVATLFDNQDWVLIDAIYDGGTTTGAIKLFLDGIQMDSADSSAGSFTSMRNGTAPLKIGYGVKASTGLNGKYIYGETTQITVNRSLPSQPELVARYAAGVALGVQNGNSLLLGSTINKRLVVQPYTGHVLIVHNTVGELRDAEGGIVGTYSCTGCDTLTSADFFRVSGEDSLGGGFVLAGKLGMRFVVPRTPIANMAAGSQYPKPYEISFPVKVDSSGAADFWTIQDAINAAGNVGRKVIEIARGTYPNPLTSIPSGMHIHGSGPSTIVSNANSTSSPAITVGNNNTYIADLAVQTASGAGGGKDAVYVTSDTNEFSGVTVLQSDNVGFKFMSGADRNRMTNCDVVAADSSALKLESIWNVVVGATFTSTRTPLWIDNKSNNVSSCVARIVAPDTLALELTANADSSVIFGNTIDGKGRILSGNVKSVVQSNSFRGAWTPEGGVTCVGCVNGNAEP